MLVEFEHGQTLLAVFIAIYDDYMDLRNKLDEEWSKFCSEHGIEFVYKHYIESKTFMC